MNAQSTPARVAIDPVADLELLGRLGRAWRQIRRGAAAGALRDIIYGIGAEQIEPGQMDALDVLVGVESYRMGDLAEALNIEPSTATRAVQRLIKDGLVEHVERAGDRRVVNVAVTAKGREIHSQVAERRRTVLISVLNEFEPDEREELIAFMERFVGAVETSSKKKRYTKK